MSTSIQERKLELIQWLSLIDDASILDRLTNVKDESMRDWWDDTSALEQESILKGLDDAQNGRLKQHADARALYEEAL